MTRSDALSGRAVLVAGGTTDLGEEVVRQLILAGADVVVPITCCSEGDRLLQIVDDTRLRFGTFDFAEVDGVGDNAEDFLQDDVPDAVVDVLGGWGSDLGSSADPSDPAVRRRALTDAMLPRLISIQGLFIQIVGGDLDASRNEVDSLVSRADDVLRRGLAERHGARSLVRRIRINSEIVGPGRRRRASYQVTTEDIGRLVVEILRNADAPESCVIGVAQHPTTD